MSSEWKMVRLGDLGQVITGNTPKTSIVANYESEDISFYKPSDLTENIDMLNSSEFKVSQFAYYNSRQLPKGTVLVSCIGIIGKVGILNEDAICNQQINAIIPNSNISSKFIAYCVVYNRHRLQKIANAPVVPIINKSAFSDVKICLPSFEKQREIAAVLDKASELVEKRKVQLAELDRLAESVFYDIFGDPVTNPKGWEKKKFGNIVRIITGNTPSREIEGYYNENFIEWVKSDNISNDNLYPTKAREFLSEVGANKGRCVDENAILITCIAGSIKSVGTSCMTDRKVAFNQQINAAIPIAGIIYPLFLLSLLRLSQKYIQDNATNGMKHIITKSNLEKLYFIVPSVILQQQFVSIIEKIEEQKTMVKAALKESEELFQRLMQDMFKPGNDNI